MKNLSKTLSQLSLCTAFIAALGCTKNQPSVNTLDSSATLKPLTLDVKKIQPKFCYELKNDNIGLDMYLRGLDNSLIRVMLAGSGTGRAVYTHDQFQYTGKDGKEKIAVKVTVKEGMPYESNDDAFGKTGILAFDYSSSTYRLSASKIAELELKAYNKFLNSQVDFARCAPNKSAICDKPCGDLSNPDFDSCTLNKKALRCDGYTSERVRGVCSSDCGSIFQGDQKGYLGCVDSKFHVIANSDYEKCNNFAQYTCNLNCSDLPTLVGRKQCERSQHIECK